MLAPAPAPTPESSAVVHLTVRTDSRLPGITVHRRPGLTAGDLRTRHGLTLSSPAWTMLDVAGTLQPRALERAFDHLLVHRLMRPSQLRELLGRFPTIAGRRRVVRLLDREQGPGVTRSEAEERLLALVRGGELPEPEVNVRRHGWEIDFLWPEARLAVEMDGYQFHSTHANFTRDRRKDAQLAAHGITVIRFTWDQLVDTLRWSRGSAACLPSGADCDQAVPDGPGGTSSPGAPGCRRRGNGPSRFQAEPGRPGSSSTMKNPTKVSTSPKVSPTRSV